MAGARAAARAASAVLGCCGVSCGSHGAARGGRHPDKPEPRTLASHGPMHQVWDRKSREDPAKTSTDWFCGDTSGPRTGRPPHRMTEAADHGSAGRRLARARVRGLSTMDGWEGGFKTNTLSTFTGVTGGRSRHQGGRKTEQARAGNNDNDRAENLDTKNIAFEKI